MLTPLLKIAAPLVLFLALVFAACAVSATLLPGGEVEAVPCCEKEAEEKTPTGGECTDPGCGCLACSVSLLSHIPGISSAAVEYRALAWALVVAVPAPPGRSIDYPPEHS